MPNGTGSNTTPTDDVATTVGTVEETLATGVDTVVLTVVGRALVLVAARTIESGHAPSRTISMASAIRFGIEKEEKYTSNRIRLY
jgi:hypothetical protein